MENKTVACKSEERCDELEAVLRVQMQQSAQSVLAGAVPTLRLDPAVRAAVLAVAPPAAPPAPRAAPPPPLAGAPRHAYSPCAGV